MHLIKPGRYQSIVAQPQSRTSGFDPLTKAKESSDDDGAGLSSQSKDNDRIRVSKDRDTIRRVRQRAYL